MWDKVCVVWPIGCPIDFGRREPHGEVREDIPVRLEVVGIIQCERRAWGPSETCQRERSAEEGVDGLEARV